LHIGLWLQALAGSWLLGVGWSVLLVLYLFGAFRRQFRYHLNRLPSPQSPDFDFTLACLSDSFITQGQATQFWTGADAIYQARLDAIASAQRSILFETFYMSPGQRADDFAQALMDKAQQGVQVKLIADSYGVKSLPSRYWKTLRQAGIQVGFFNRFNWRSPLDYLDRTHRKLLLVDERLALIGGAGVSDLWDQAPIIGGHHPWLDFEIALEGEVVSVLRGIFLQHWLDTRGQVDFQHRNLTSSPNRYPRILVTPGEDPTYRNSSIRSLLQVAIMAAERRVWIASPYFLPDLNTRHEMIAAQTRGVDIRILTMGPLSDKPFVYHAAQCRYRQLLEAGVAIYEYQPSMMHSKLLLLDDIWVSIGSANFDPRSFFHNDELNLTTAEPQLFDQVEQFFKQAFTACDRITPQRLAKRPWLHRLIGHSSLLFYWHL